MSIVVVFPPHYRSETHCPDCGNRFAPSKDIAHPSRRTRDHIFPQEWGGDNVFWFSQNRIMNIRIVCSDCNQLRAKCNHCVGAMTCARALAENLDIRQRPAVHRLALNLFGRCLRPNKNAIRRIMFGAPFVFRSGIGAEIGQKEAAPVDIGAAELTREETSV